jgi:hypothetical protein
VRSGRRIRAGRPATLGGAPSAVLSNPFLGAFADRLLAADIAEAVGAANTSGPNATALGSLLRVLDTTRFAVDLTGRSGDEHLSLLFGHPMAVVRAFLLIKVDDARRPPENQTTSVPVKLGTLGHLDDGLLATSSQTTTTD